jgi:hypothetical protein
MKLSVISEVANPQLSNMDYVEVAAQPYSDEVFYIFEDPNISDIKYAVTFRYASDRVTDYLVQHDPVYRHIAWNDDDWGRRSYTLDLETEDSLYEKTGKGNFGFVYGKLMACVIDFFVKRKTKVLLLQFTGNTSDMELVYKRIMDRLNAEYPSMAMHPYEPDSVPGLVDQYISIAAINNIKDENLKQQALNSIQGKKHSDRLKKIKERKKARDPKDQGNIY